MEHSYGIMLHKLPVGEWAGFPNVQENRKIELVACKAAQFMSDSYY